MTDKLHKVAGANGGVFMTGFLPGSNTIVSLMPDTKTKATQEKFSEKPTGDYVFWGTSNTLPSDWRKKLEASTTAYPLLFKLVTIIFGRGLYYYQENISREGNITNDFTRIPEVDEFLDNNDIPFLMKQRLMDYKFLGNCWCEFILSNDMSKITTLSHLEAEFTRFAVNSNDASKFDFIKYTGDWGSPENIVDIPFLNRQDANADFIKKKYSGPKKFSFHSYFPSPGRTIYAFPPHGAIFKEKGWLDYTNSIPGIMNAINEQAANIKYHVRIPYDYWRHSNENWDNLEPEKQKEIIDKKLAELNDFLKQNSNAGKTLYTHFATDSITGKPLAGWEIIEMEDKAKKDSFLTSVQEGDMQTARAWGVDTSISGIQAAGGKMGAGSGSDKRTGFDNQVNSSFADVEIIVEPLKLVGKYNGWPPNLKWGFLHEIPVPLNEDLSGTKTEM
jgi:hypothetical protein